MIYTYICQMWSTAFDRFIPINSMHRHYCQHSLGKCVKSFNRSGTVHSTLHELRTHFRCILSNAASKNQICFRQLYKSLELIFYLLYIVPTFLPCRAILICSSQCVQYFGQLRPLVLQNTSTVFSHESSFSFILRNILLLYILVEKYSGLITGSLQQLGCFPSMKSAFPFAAS